MKSVAEIKQNLAHEYGSDDPYTVCSLWKNLVFTGGVKRLREAADAFWLIDAIASYRRTEKFQLWTLQVNTELKVGTLKMTDGNSNNPIVFQEIKYTDFPLPKIEFYVEHGGYGDPWKSCLVLMLTTETLTDMLKIWL